MLSRDIGTFVRAAIGDSLVPGPDQIMRAAIARLNAVSDSITDPKPCDELVDAIEEVAGAL